MAFYTAEQVANMFQLGTVDELFDEELLRGVAKKEGIFPWLPFYMSIQLKM